MSAGKLVRGLPTPLGEMLARLYVPAGAVLSAQTLVTDEVMEHGCANVAEYVRNELAHLIADAIARDERLATLTKRRADDRTTAHRLQTVVMPLDEVGEMLRLAYERGVRGKA